MNNATSNPLQEQLSALERQIQRRVFLGSMGYALGLVGAIGLLWFFPFNLSRIGSVVLIVSLANMLWKVRDASRQPVRRADAGRNPLVGTLNRVDAQIRLIQSLIFNVPFLAGANVFFMGLPGPGPAEHKAVLDCLFLLGTVMVFSGCYVLNQRAVRQELLPLRRELVKGLLNSDTAAA
jgi:hypothetical protein